MGHWECQLADGRGIRIAQVRPPANFASLVRGKTLQGERWTFSGFLAPGGIRLLRVTEDGKEPVWVQIAVQEAAHYSYHPFTSWAHSGDTATITMEFSR